MHTDHVSSREPSFAIARDRRAIATPIATPAASPMIIPAPNPSPEVLDGIGPGALGSDGANHIATNAIVQIPPTTSAVIHNHRGF